MGVIGVGEAAPPVPGVTFADGPVALVFYKVTCPVCQMAAPKVDVMAAAYPGRVVGVGQDPPDALDRFGREFGMDVPAVPDLPPYDASNAYGIESVPTLFVIDRTGAVADAVVSWDRAGYNRASGRLAELLGVEPAMVSDSSDGLPPFRPG
ncbi:MAG TPA: redoxin domain-containing protein [Actinomycetota bacterium]|nr:redoxin domain-containing protein [Actinomycetota bacterium]